VTLTTHLHPVPKLGASLFIPLHYLYTFVTRMGQIYLTPWSRILLQKLTVPRLVKKCSVFYRTQKFITVFTTATQLSLSWANSVVYALPAGSFQANFDKILKYTFISSKWSLSFKFYRQPLVHFSFPSRVLHARPSHRPRLDNANNILWYVHIQALFRSYSLAPNMFLSPLLSNDLKLRSSLSMRDQHSHPYKALGKSIICVF
jgi:hypothetical protein